MVEPKKAAACIVMRGGDVPEILMVRRADTLRFMGGHHVFPGGRIEDDETGHRVEGAPSDERARALHAVAREVFEESGILCAEGPLPTTEQTKEAQRALLSEERTFDEILDTFDLTIRAEDFESAGHWITPSMSPIRFDTQYFLYWLKRDQEAHHLDGEIAALEWMSAVDARKRWHTGELRISAPVAYALHHLAAVPFPDVLHALGRPTDREPGLPNRFEFRRGITIVPLATRTIPPATHTNCVIIGEDDLYIIDPGAIDAEELAHLKNQLDHLIELGGTPKAVVLTHSHPDHIGGVTFMQQNYALPIWAHEAVQPQVEFPIDRFIADDEVLHIPGEPGWRLRALHTPGHDPGHLAFYEETTRTLLAGDLIANPGTIVVSEEYGGNMNDFLASLERVKTLDAKLLIPAHGLAVRNSKQKLQEHIDHRLWRENKIKEAIQSGYEDLQDLLKKAYDDVPEAALPLAEHALRAHLTRLGVTV